MKQLLLFILVTSLLAPHGFAQATGDKDPVAKMLTRYYGIKDALAAGNSVDAAAGALQFIKTLNSIDYKIISEGTINVLLKDATLISETGDLQQQRVQFANLSDNMIAISKAVRLSTQPLYLLYCADKKVSWLSSDKTVKNPYENGMTGCGAIIETIQ